MEKIVVKKEEIYKGNLILVNRENDIKEKIKENNLKPFDKEYSDILLENNANIELQKALNHIKSENKIVPVSGYRTLEEQKEIYQTSLKENGEKFTKQYVAYPNCSEHQTGLAIDLGLNQENIDFIRPSFPYTGICQEFRNIATKYGFIERYTKNKENITKISSEEWHFRYVGYPHSEIMKQNNQCLEEYIKYLEKFEYGKSVLSYKDYEISYMKIEEDFNEIFIKENEIIDISGNNIDGIIITKRRKR
ncbi:MAG: M15 family metallopeptidase [Clostridia bacterium]|jgi:D-alanyl-D-alanine dipeptidase/carboxypeptidase|nr:M15 family metallopeptidase [Clostridia bacterium]